MASRPCTSTSASAPDRKAALTTPPRAVASRRLALLVRGMERDATQAMSGSPTLIVSYSGVLGGAERILLDCATRLGEPVVVACPEGPLAAAVRAAGLEHAALPERPLRLGAAHARGLAGLAREVRALSARRRPRALVAWGARAVLATAPLPAPAAAAGRPHGPAAAPRASPPRCAGRRAAPTAWPPPPRRSRAAVGARAATILHPGVDLERFAAAPRPERRAARARARRARAVEAPGPRARGRRARARAPARARRRADPRRRRRLRARRSRRAPRRATWPAA